MLIKNPCWDPSPTAHARKIAQRYAKEAVTPEQKAWVIDQMVRALTYCPLVVTSIQTARGEVLEVELLGESSSYLEIASDPDWDKGIPI